MNPAKTRFPLRTLALFAALVFCGLAGGSLPALAAPVRTLTMKPAPDMGRAVLKYGEVPPGCAGALVLCPGYNQDGEELMRDGAWQAFARKHKLVLIGLSFSSPEFPPEARRGYYYPEKGSGRLLLDGVAQIVGRDVPLVLFGISGGAHFTHRFAYRNPFKVRAWAACSFGWGDPATSPVVKPPGIFVCGAGDERRKATFDAFSSAAGKGWPVCWLEVPNAGHAEDKRATGFVRSFLDAALSLPPRAPGIRERFFPTGNSGETREAWFPDETVRDAWRRFGK